LKWTVGLLVVVFWLTTVSAAGPWPTPWVWDSSTQVPTLTLLLGGPKFSKSLSLPVGCTQVRLVLKKYVLTEDGVKLEWRSGTQLWMSKTKKIPGRQSTERVALPPGAVSLRVWTLTGKLLAEITLPRK
jgi:hypothetical protein